MKNKGKIIMNILSLIIGLSAGVLAFDSIAQSVSLVNPQVAKWWPLVLTISMAISRLASIVRDWAGDLADDGEINNSYPKKTPPDVPKVAPDAQPVVELPKRDYSPRPNGGFPAILVAVIALSCVGCANYGVSASLEYQVVRVNANRQGVHFGIDGKQVVRGLKREK